MIEATAAAAIRIVFYFYFLFFCPFPFPSFPFSPFVVGISLHTTYFESSGGEAQS